MNLEKQLDKLLKQYRFILVRQDKHHVYRNHEGKVYVTASTPSDRWALQNQFSELKRVIASPPMATILALEAFERRLAENRATRLAIEAAKAQLQKRGGNGGQYSKTNGTGFYYDEPKVVVVNPEQQARDKEDERLRREEKKGELAMEQKFIDAMLDGYYVDLSEQIGINAEFHEFLLKENFASLLEEARHAEPLTATLEYCLSSEKAGAVEILRQTVNAEPDISLEDAHEYIEENLERLNQARESLDSFLPRVVPPAMRKVWREYRRTGDVSEKTEVCVYNSVKSLPTHPHFIWLPRNSQHWKTRIDNIVAGREPWDDGEEI
jgi:hypothetical protein